MTKKGYENKVGVPCPRCSKRYLWDFCADAYQDLEGEFCDVEKDVTPDGLEESHYFCNDVECRQYLSSYDEDGEMIACESFTDVNWDTDENSASPC